MTRLTHADPATPSAPRRVGWLVLLIAAVCFAPLAQGDEIQRNGQPIRATATGVTDGALTYLTPAGTQRSVPLGELELLKLDSEPQFAEAMLSFQAEDYRRAQRAFGEIAERTDADWVRHLAWYYQVHALDKRGEATDAGTLYAEMARDGADASLLAIPPVASLKEANEDQRGRIQAEIVAVMENAEGAVRDRLSAYLRVVVGDGEMPDIANPAAPNGGTESQIDRTASAVILPNTIWSLLEREDAEQRWTVVTLMSEGKYTEALEALDPWLSNPQDMPEKLFILGRIQLAQADASGDRDAYLDAGLSFMRVIVHYERLDSPLVAPAKLEVAYIHRQIDRVDIYDKMLFDDNLSLLFDNDAQTYPQYYRRYYEILGEPLPSDEPEAELEEDAEDE